MFFNLRKSKKHLGWLSKHETEAVARDLRVSTSEVTEMEQRLAGQDLSFDPASDADEDQAYAPALFLPNPDADPAETLENEDWQKQAGIHLQQALDSLDERSRGILRDRWLAEKKATLQNLAKRYGVSAERIRQIEKAAIRKLRIEMTAT